MSAARSIQASIVGSKRRTNQHSQRLAYRLAPERPFTRVFCRSFGPVCLEADDRRLTSPAKSFPALWASIRPCSKSDTITSSSIPGQVIATPPAIRRQSRLCLAVALRRLGSHWSGMIISRPSASTTCKRSALTLTLIASGSIVSDCSAASCRRPLLRRIRCAVGVFCNASTQAGRFLPCCRRKRIVSRLPKSLATIFMASSANSSGGRSATFRKHMFASRIGNLRIKAHSCLFSLRKSAQSADCLYAQSLMIFAATATPLPASMPFAPHAVREYSTAAMRPSVSNGST